MVLPELTKLDGVPDVTAANLTLNWVVPLTLANVIVVLPLASAIENVFEADVLTCPSTAVSSYALSEVLVVLFVGYARS